MACRSAAPLTLELDDLSSGILRFLPKSVSVNPFSFAWFTALSMYSLTEGKAEK